MWARLMQIKQLKFLLMALLWGAGFAFSATAQSAEDYFHGGAQNFIYSDVQQAISEVQAGLNQYPNDPKLNALMQMLKEEQEKQQQQQNEQQSQQNPQQQQQSTQISKAEAEKILKALEQKEKELLKEFKKQKTESSNSTNEKDW